ncbi:MAG: M20/M25/M40 family metallo-hydrolase, partial [Armatimonadetes bacterium]|nr:M20/M25/M40 family metallo-hydrolase [Armatimonadota bacterium]
MSSQASEYLDEHQQDLVETLVQLVQTETTNPYCGDRNPSGEGPGQEVLAKIAGDLGEVTTFEPPPDIYERMGVLGPLGRDFSGRPNLVIEIDLPSDGPTVVINGHMDTVGIDNMTIEPLAAEVRDGWVHGRGTSDCKGGITIALWAVRAALATGDNLGGKIIFESVVDEECNGSGAGTLACLDAGYRGDVAIFVDGYDRRVSRGCYGCLTAEVLVEGREGHAASSTGVSAIEKALVIKQGLDEFKRRREELYPDARVNLGVFNAGTHPAVVPGLADLQLNIVYRLEDARASVEAGHPWGAALLREEFTAAVMKAAATDEWFADHPPQVGWIKDLIPFEEPLDSPWLAALQQAYREATAEEPELHFMIGWTDASYYSALAGIPTFLIGPSADGAAHSPTEQVEL